MKTSTKIITACAAAGTLAAAIAAGEVFLTVGMRRGTNITRVSKKNKTSTPDKPLVDRFDNRKEWVYEHIPKDVTKMSYDGLTLHSLLIENPGHTDKFVIICHGYTGHSDEMGFYAEKFYDRGYSCLLPSARGHDKSEGKYMTMGWPERKDICGWIYYLNRRYDNPEIILYGVSMGAAAVMMTAGEPLPSNVKCGIEDCGYSSIKEEFAYVLKNMLKIPVQPLLFCGCVVAFFHTGINFRKDGITTRQLEKSALPMLFIHGTEDKFVPPYMLDKCYAAHRGPKEFLMVEGARHASAAFTGGDKYWDKVFNFTEKYV